MASSFSFKQTIALVFAITSIGFGSTMNVFAGDSPIKHVQSLVALGDSVTFGYNLDDTDGNTVPSPSSFPELIGQSDKLSVSNLGVPGFTATDLLHALQTPDFVRTIDGASVVTLDIGSNDLIHIANEAGLLQMAFSPTQIRLTESQQQVISTGATQVGQSLISIVTAIRAKTDAPILFYNLYNPFPDTSVLHIPGEQLEQIINQTIENIAKTTPGVLYVDAHQTFDHHQSTYVRIAQGDIHPTFLGQQVLASIGESSISPFLSNFKDKSGVLIGQMAGNIQTTGGSVSANLCGNAITLNVPPGAFGTVNEVDVTSTSLPGLASIVPANEKIVAEGAVHFTSGVKVSKPFMLTIASSNILPGGSVYQIEGNKFAFIPGAKVTQGKAVIPSTTEGDFVVVEPTLTAIPGATKPETGFPALIDAGIAFVLVGFGGCLMYVGCKKRQN